VDWHGWRARIAMSFYTHITTATGPMRLTTPARGSGRGQQRNIATAVNPTKSRLTNRGPVRQCSESTLTGISWPGARQIHNSTSKYHSGGM
jgi:hypothetical protein